MADEIRTLAEGANIAYDILEGTSSSDWFAYYAKHVLMQKNAMTNLVVNGNFANGATGWGVITAGTLSLGVNALTYTATSANNAGGIYQNGFSWIAFHKYYISLNYQLFYRLSYSIAI